jgi:hypothetical protein
VLLSGIERYCLVTVVAVGRVVKGDDRFNLDMMTVLIYGATMPNLSICSSRTKNEDDEDDRGSISTEA